MFADVFQNSSSGKLTEGIELDSSIKSVVEFIEIYFAEFSIKVNGETTASEKSLTDKLCKYLNRNASTYPFYFHHENVEDHSSGISPQTDIGILSYNEQLNVEDRNYGEFDSFFSIEAKRLPTPGQKREKEYVIGYEKPCGGIERFKKGIHGKNLRYAAIIGYIQKEDTDYWFLEINNWISELIISASKEWTDDDKLTMEQNQVDGLDKFKSTNLRFGNRESEDFISLFHFWINLTNKQLN